MAEPVKSQTPLTRVCPFCKSSGECGKCNGTGEVTTVHKGRFKKIKQVVSCRACEGSGVCQLCHGSGRLYSRAEPSRGRSA